MSNQKEIDALLDDSWGLDSEAKDTRKSSLSPQGKDVKNNVYDQSYSYGKEQFDDYDESKRTQSFVQSQSQSVSQSQMKKNKNDKTIDMKTQNQNLQKKLTSIKQQSVNKKKQTKKQEDKVPQIYIKPALELRTQSAFNKKQNSTFTAEKQNNTQNYAKLQQRERQLLLTTLRQQNKHLKGQILQKSNALKKSEAKYKMLLEQKTQKGSTAKELALEKKIINLQGRLEQMASLQKIAEEKNKFKAKINKTGGFVPEEEMNHRQAELLELIDKLKTRLLHSDQNMGVLQKKLNQGVQHNDELHRKMKRVEQLEYRIQKMTEQAQTDRGYIELMKEKVKELQKQVESEKNRNRKQQVEMKRMEMGQLTHSDILKELEQTRRQKQLLEKSLKDMSSAMMNTVRKNYQNSTHNIEDSEQLLQPNKSRK